MKAKDTTKLCESFGFDLCILSSEEVAKLDDYMYFAIRCYQSCDIRFRVQYTEEMELAFGKKSKFYMTQNLTEKQTQIFKIKVPSTDPKGNSFSHLVFNFNVLNIYDLQKPIKLLLKHGSIPSSDNPDNMSPMTNWAAGKTFTIFSDSKYFCTDCTYYISLYAEKKAMFGISSYGYS